MTSPITCLPKDMSVGDAAQLFLKQEINSAPIVNEAGLLVGIVSEKDIMEGLGHQQGWNATVAEIMTPRVIHYEPESRAELIFEFLCRVQIQRVVIVEYGRPVGLISRGSFLRWIQNYVNVSQVGETTFDARPRLLKTADALSSRAQMLRDELEEDPDEIVKPVVNGVSSLQGLIGELLSWARCSQSTQETKDCVVST
jgi:signal-transduction protein with cAMP-binding, CBS, and nucleotidyltransferase domain